MYSTVVVSFAWGDNVLPLNSSLQPFPWICLCLALLHLLAVLFLSALASSHLTHPLMEAFEPGGAYLQCAAVNYNPVLVEDGLHSCSGSFSEPGRQASVATPQSRRL